MDARGKPEKYNTRSRLVRSYPNTLHDVRHGQSQVGIRARPSAQSAGRGHGGQRVLGEGVGETVVAASAASASSAAAVAVVVRRSEREAQRHADRRDRAHQEDRGQVHVVLWRVSKIACLQVSETPYSGKRTRR